MDVNPEVLKVGLVSAHVCVPGEWTNQQVEDFVNMHNPTGLDHGWRVHKTKDPERVPCEDRCSYVHVVLVC